VSEPAVAVAGGIRLAVHVQPRAARTEVVGLYGGALKVRVASPPVDGAANQEVVRFLAQRLGIPRSRVELISGAGARRKSLLLRGVSLQEVRHRLAF